MNPVKEKNFTANILTEKLMNFMDKDIIELNEIEIYNNEIIGTNNQKRGKDVNKIDNTNSERSEYKPMNGNIEMEINMSLTYKIQALFLNSEKIIPSILKINKDNLSFLHSDTKSEIFSIIFADLIGASITKDKLISVKEVDLLSEIPITISFCPKIQIINSKSCCNNSDLNTFSRKIKQINIFIQEESQIELTNIFNNIALYNKISKLNPSKKKFLVFVNPTSGKGKSLKTWLEAKTVFDLSHIEVDLIRTRYYRHAYDYVLSMEGKKVNDFYFM